MECARFLAAVSTLAVPLSASAQIMGPDLGSGQKATLLVSGFWADIDTVARAAGTGGRIGTRLDLEKDLGLADHELRMVAGLSYHFNRRHGVELSYFDLHRSAQRTLSTDIDFLDETFARQTTLNTSFDTEIWRLSYAYALVDSQRHRVVAQIGAHLPRVEVDLNRTGGTRNADARAKSPLPVIGFAYTYRLSSRWMLDARGQIFRLQVDDIDGRIDNFSALGSYQATRNLSVFMGYNYYLLDVDLSKQFWNGEAKLDFKGPWVGVIAGFGGQAGK